MTTTTVIEQPVDVDTVQQHGHELGILMDAVLDALDGLECPDRKTHKIHDKVSYFVRCAAGHARALSLFGNHDEAPESVSKGNAA